MFEEIIRKSTDRVFAIIDNIQAYQGVELSDRMMRFLKFCGYKALPFIINIATYFTLFYILNRIRTKYGFEQMIMVALVILILKRSQTTST